MPGYYHSKKNKKLILSRGSKNHDKGLCRPCLYIAQGVECPNGRMCNFCHAVHSVQTIEDFPVPEKFWSRQQEIDGAKQTALDDEPYHAEVDVKYAKQMEYTSQKEYTHPLTLTRPSSLYSSSSDEDLSFNSDEQVEPLAHVAGGFSKEMLNLVQWLWPGCQHVSGPQQLAQLLTAAMPETYSE
eukprot:gb/GFBE01018526.1/.p1 GENE.gb/GFBE01018526.1/~~gb/GFBE01018526.1/.p1  ORF type:complete len:184 (+),score=47.57 gb/GFBE01018526.1/:1-552(+)